MIQEMLLYNLIATFFNETMMNAVSRIGFKIGVLQK